MKTVLKPAFLLVLLFACCVLRAQTVDFDAIGKGLVNQLVARQFDKVESQFDDQMKAALPVAKLPEVWDSLLAQVGPFKSIAAAKVMEKQGLAAAIITCEFERASLDAKIYMDAQGRVKGLFFEPASGSPDAAPAEAEWQPPSYAKPDKFRERDTTVISGRWELPGVLTLPNIKSAVPAVVLVQGSGPHDQDETIGSSKPFKDLAYGLASQNVAVLRYNKRTLQYGKEIKAQEAGFTVNEETVDDARAAVTLLAKRPEIDPRRIFVLGHS